MKVFYNKYKWCSFIFLVFFLNTTTTYSQQSLLKNIPLTEKDTVKLKIGGAIRLNYSWQDYNDERKDKIGDFGFELFRLNVDVDYNDIFLSAEQRWYEEFYCIHHAYFGYHINKHTDVQIGISQVPFGISPYAAHSFWFNITYYLGFEDDYDAGIKFIYDTSLWNIQVAFYKNSEYANSTNYGRYSFDIVTDDIQANEEINQLNLRGFYKWKINIPITMNIGSSLEFGELYNQITRRKGSRHAYSLHNDINYKKWNIHLQWINYSFTPKNPINVSSKTIQFGAFQFPFMVSSKANIYTFNIAKDIPIKNKYIEAIRFYGNFSAVSPKKEYGSDSKQLVLGTRINKRGLYGHFDFIAGQNMWFSGGPGIGLQHQNDINWHSRVNVNLGYYFN